VKVNKLHRKFIETTERCLTIVKEIRERKTRKRKRIYRRLIDAGKMSAAEAAREIELMTAIRENLENQQQPKLF
jgi:hypothetical protein